MGEADSKPTHTSLTYLHGRNLLIVIVASHAHELPLAFCIKRLFPNRVWWGIFICHNGKNCQQYVIRGARALPTNDPWEQNRGVVGREVIQGQNSVHHMACNGAILTMEIHQEAAKCSTGGENCPS